MLKLEATTKNEKLILDYLKENASEALKEKINNGEKTLSQCWSYIVSEAQKLAEKCESCGSKVEQTACVTSDILFGWAVHFFEEDSIKAEMFKITPPVKTVTSKPSKPQTPKSQGDQLEQLSLFDM